MGLRISYRGSDVNAVYNLTLRNQSGAPWIFYIYQGFPYPEIHIYSLVWLASPSMIPVGGQVTFTWWVRYNFVWGETGSLQPGLIFNAGQVIDADPAGANTTTFSASPAPNLSPAVAATHEGVLRIDCAGPLPVNLYSVGIGMAGVGTFVAQAASRLRYQFTPTAPPRYWIGFGTDIRVGTVLDRRDVSSPTEGTF